MSRRFGEKDLGGKINSRRAGGVTHFAQMDDGLTAGGASTARRTALPFAAAVKSTDRSSGNEKRSQTDNAGRPGESCVRDQGRTDIGPQFGWVAQDTPSLCSSARRSWQLMSAPPTQVALGYRH